VKDYKAAFDSERSTVYTVTRLNRQIKGLLEATYPYVWVKGEISNFRAPASGHCYFSLKDERSQMRAVFFRSGRRLLRFRVEDGLEVVCQGRIGVYEVRGEYQLIVDRMEPVGQGALQLAFEQLKEKLKQEGLFDAASKLPLPACPRRIALITSPTGAAIRDMLEVFQQAPCPLTLTILPVKVQGAEAAGEIAAALDKADELADDFGWDLVIAGRGGGSLEDLWPFNEEVVARAIARCRIPVVSAVGHEIDTTISDMAADLRAPTPTAAARWVTERLEDIVRSLEEYRSRLRRVVDQSLSARRKELEFLARRLPRPRRRLEDSRVHVDDRGERLRLASRRRLEKARERFHLLEHRLGAHDPRKILERRRELLGQRRREMALHYRKILDRHRLALQKCALKLDGLSPLGILSRGYSITYRMPQGEIVRDPSAVERGDRLKVRLEKGSLECRVISG